MHTYDIRSAKRPNADQELVDIARYAARQEVDSQEAYATARYCLLESLAWWLGAARLSPCAAGWVA